MAVPLDVPVVAHLASDAVHGGLVRREKLLPGVHRRVMAVAYLDVHFGADFAVVPFVPGPVQC